MDKVDDMRFYAIPAMVIETKQLKSLVDSMVTKYVVVVLLYCFSLSRQRSEYIRRGFIIDTRMRFIRVGRRLIKI